MTEISTEPDAAPEEPTLPDEPYPSLHIGESNFKPPTVNQAIVLCMREIGAVAKSRYNEGQKFNFRGIDQFLNAVHRVMAKYGLTIVPASMNHELTARDRYRDGVLQGYSMHVVNKVRWEAEGPAGDKKYFETVGEAADSADKATNKSISAAEKYMLISVFKIPTDDIAEGDSDNPNTGSRQATGGGGGGQSRGQQSGGGGGTAGTGVKPTEPQMKAMGALANEVIGKEAKQIKAVMLEITGRVSSRAQMSRAEASKVIETLKAIQKGDRKIVFGGGDPVTVKIYGKGEEPFLEPPTDPPSAPSEADNEAAHEESGY